MQVKDEHENPEGEHLLGPGDSINFDVAEGGGPAESYIVLKRFNFLEELARSGVTIEKAAEGLLSFTEQAQLCHYLVQHGFLDQPGQLS